MTVPFVRPFSEPASKRLDKTVGDREQGLKPSNKKQTPCNPLTFIEPLDLGPHESTLYRVQKRSPD